MRKLTSILTWFAALSVLCGCGVKLETKPIAKVTNAAARPAQKAVLPPQPERLPPAGPMSFLRAEGRRIVDDRGAPVQLSGCNIGGWLLMEPWMVGLDNQPNAGTEKEVWDTIGQRFGRETKLELIKVFRENFFQESDVEQIAGLGLNCLRIPIWWRATDDPDYGGDVTYLDRCIEWCRKNGVYVIIDLQGAPGGQASESSNVGEPAYGGALWKTAGNKDRTVDWWKRIAERYKDDPAVAAYDLLNEGTAVPKYGDLVELYDRLYKAIREIDSRHILIMEEVWGNHLLPFADDMGWSNVVYSFHYYPRNMKLEQALEAADVDIPKYNRTSLYKGVPTYVGEFNPIDARNGGANLFLKYREVCEYFGWAWTFWSYKAIQENDNVIWGVYGYYKDRPIPDLANDDLEKIRADFRRMATTNSFAHPLLPAALTAPIRWEADPNPYEGGIVLSLRDAFVMASDKGYLRYEWGWTIPNIGYWSQGDAVAWKFNVSKAGVYELVLRVANNSDKTVASVWLDGVLAAKAPVKNTAGWRRFRDRTICRLELAEGPHVLEIGQADSEKGFINLQCAWLAPSPDSAWDPEEKAIVLKAVNMDRLPPMSPIRVEWLNNPPNIGSWSAGAQASWSFTLKKAGSFSVQALYATETALSNMKLMLDGQLLIAKDLKATGGWQEYKADELGTADLAPGRHMLTVKWDVNEQTAAGNLRAVRFERMAH